jgi:hypothetical protein
VQVPERKRTTIIKQIRIVMVTIKAFIVLDFTHRRAKAMAAIIIGHWTRFANDRFSGIRIIAGIVSIVGTAR